MSDLTDERGGIRSPCDSPLSGGGTGPPSRERMERLLDGLESAADAIDKDGSLGPLEAESLRTLREAAGIRAGTAETPRIPDSLPTAPRSGPARPSGAPPGLAPLPVAGPARRPRFRLPIPLAAAALVVFGALLYGLLARRPIAWPPGVIGIIAQHIPGELARTRGPDSTPERHDRFQFTASEECHVFLFFRSWRSGLKARHWSYQLWRDNSPRRQVAADETIACEMNVAEDPPIPQFYVLAASRLPGDLPGGEEEAQALLKSVEEAFRKAGSRDDLPACVAAVRASLPPSVAVVGGEFVVR